MKVASSASVTTLLVLLIVGILNLSDTSNAACCYVGCNLPRCNPCRTASACGPKGSCASSSCHATRNILRDDTFSLVEEGTLVAKGHEPKHTDDLVKVSSAEALSKKDGVKSRFQERAAKHNIQPNAAGACCKTNCNTIGCTKCAHVLGNTCSHGSCNANECSGASAVLAPVKTLEDEHAGVIEDRQAKELKRNLNGGNCCATQCRIPGCHKCGVVYGKTCSYGYCSPGSCSAGVTMDEVLSAEARFLAGESNGVEGDGKMAGHEEETHAASD